MRCGQRERKGLLSRVISSPRTRQRETHHHDPYGDGERGESEHAEQKILPIPSKAPPPKIEKNPTPILEKNTLIADISSFPIHLAASIEQRVPQLPGAGSRLLSVAAAVRGDGHGAFSLLLLLPLLSPFPVIYLFTSCILCMWVNFVLTVG